MVNCSVENCDKSALSRGMCSKHYQHARYHGVIPRAKTRPRCSIEGCDHEAHAKGVCIKHYMKSWRNREAVNDGSFKDDV